MTVLITIAALFAVQIYVPALAGAWPRMSGSGLVAFKRGGESGNAGISNSQQAGEAKGGSEIQSLENSQTQEVYGEYAISDHLLIVSKHLVLNGRLAAATRRRLDLHDCRPAFVEAISSGAKPGRHAVYRGVFGHMEERVEIHVDYAGQISLGWVSEIYEDRDLSYAHRKSYVAAGFSPSN